MFVAIRLASRAGRTLKDEFGRADVAAPDEPETKKCAYCREAVPFKASRCPRCTSTEISYRADGGVGMSGPCDANARAYTVRDYIWFRFNSVIRATPGMNATQLWNLLVAPSSDRSNQEASAETMGRIQFFHMGSLSACFGGGAIVQLALMLAIFGHPFSVSSMIWRF